MGALRRPQQQAAPQPVPEGSVHPEPRLEGRYPRWLVVSSLIAYCAVVWVIVILAGGWGIELVRTATAQP